MNPQTDSYHNLLIQGGQDGRDMPTTKTGALEEFEANIESFCDDTGVQYTLTLTRGFTVNDAVEWAFGAANPKDCVFITITGHATKTLVIDRKISNYSDQIRDFFAESNLFDLTLSLRSLAHVLAVRPSRLIISTGNKPGHRLHSQPWWGRCLSMKETHSLRELAELFGTTPSAMNKAFLALNSN